jgi:sec-independent protein translocase protein TatC
VALVVIGPEKLPKVARMAGTLYGRAQRYLNEVKSEVSREIELEELRNLHKEVQEAAQSFKSERRAMKSDVEQRVLAHERCRIGLARPTRPMPPPSPPVPRRPPRMDDIERKARDFRRKKLVKTSSVPAWYKNRNGGPPARAVRRGARAQVPSRRQIQYLLLLMTEETAGEETFISHLVELRDRLVKASIGIAARVRRPAGLAGSPAIYDFLAAPMLASLPAGSKMIATGVTSPFLVPMKVTLLLAFIIALPWVFYQVWAFVAPGLYAHEKRLVLPLVISSSLLFIAGVAFCYFFVFGRVFHFIAEFAPTSIAVTPDIENYLDFVMSMCLAFGATFEVPVVVVILVRMGIVSVEKLRSIRPYAIVGAFVIAAIVTPPDVVSQLALAIPMCLLFEWRRCSCWAC